VKFQRKRAVLKDFFSPQIPSAGVPKGQHAPFLYIDLRNRHKYTMVAKTMEIHLKRFQPGNMQTNRVCLMIGKKGTGKSTIIQDIMWFQQNIPVGTIMSATEESNEAYSQMAPPLFIYKNFDAEALERLINRQIKLKSMYKQNGNYLPFDHRAFLLIDDCMYDKKSFRNILIRELFMNGRHWDLFVLISVQYLMDVTPEIRTNTDYVFALKENIRKNREKMYNEFFGVFPNFTIFDELFLEVTQDYRCLVLDNTVPSTNIEDCVFWYKARERPTFRLGADFYWDYSAKHVKGPAAGQHGKQQEKLEEMRRKVVRVVYDAPNQVNYRGTNTGGGGVNVSGSNLEQQQYTELDDGPIDRGPPMVKSRALLIGNGGGGRGAAGRSPPNRVRDDSYSDDDLPSPRRSPLKMPQQSRQSLQTLPLTSRPQVTPPNQELNLFSNYGSGYNRNLPPPQRAAFSNVNNFGGFV
jgi:hypothetical protein